MIATLPTAHDLDMWPYVADDSPLWSLAHAADISEMLPDEETCFRDDIPFQEIMSYLFDMADAHQAMVWAGTTEDLDAIVRNLERMGYHPSPLFRGLEDLLDREDYETARVVYRHLTEGDILNPPTAMT